MTRPGMYVIGLTFGRTRKSSFIDGAAADARFVTGHLAAHLGGRLDRLDAAGCALVPT